MNEKKEHQEAMAALAALRALGSADQCIALAVLVGMRLQKSISAAEKLQPKQRGQRKCQSG